MGKDSLYQATGQRTCMHWKPGQRSGQFQNLLLTIRIDAIDPSDFVDRYVKDSIGIFSLQFSPNGQLLATGATDRRLRVCSLTASIYINLILL